MGAVVASPLRSSFTRRLHRRHRWLRLLIVLRTSDGRVFAASPQVAPPLLPLRESSVNQRVHFATVIQPQQATLYDSPRHHVTLPRMASVGSSLYVPMDRWMAEHPVMMVCVWTFLNQVFGRRRRCHSSSVARCTATSTALLHVSAANPVGDRWSFPRLMASSSQRTCGQLLVFS